jgi:hypothetical protein
MAQSFPTSVPSYPDTGGSEVLGSMGGGLGLSRILDDYGLDITALATKLGTGSDTPAANQLLVGNGSGSSEWKGLTSAELAAILSDETGTGAAVFATSPTIVTPTIASFANATHNHTNAAGGGTLGSGAATPGIWTNPYCFRAYDSAGTTLTDDTVVTVNLGTEEYDYNNNFSGNTYTAPVAGVYHFDGAFNINGAVATGVYAFAALYVGSTEVSRGVTGVPVGSDTFSVSDDLLLAAGAQVTLRAYQNSAGGEATVTGSGFTHFSGHLIHQTS